MSPYTYPESALGELAGVYNSAELGTEFHLEPGKNALMVTLGHDKSRKLRFEPISKDLFHWNARMQLRILRDTSGAVTGFMYRNPAVTNIRFERKVD